MHTARFLPNARLFDVVLTTDADLVGTYRLQAAPGVRAVASLGFFAQPRLHNPLPGPQAPDPTVAYAGTYYGARYPDRSRQLDLLLDVAAPFGLAVYDRQLTETGSPYRFPPRFAGSVRGGLPYEQVVGTYRAHVAHLNVNSVTGSPTMFSRRVVEIAACGGVVLSGAARGLEETLGDAVVATDDAGEAAGWLELWTGDPVARRREAWRQMRTVLRAHTADMAVTLAARTAGLAVRRPGLPAYALLTRALTDDVVDAVVGQSVRPAVLVVPGPPDPARAARLAAAGVDVRGPGPLPGGVAWVGRCDGPLARTAMEDLLHCTTFSAATRLVPVVAREGDEPWLVRPGQGRGPAGQDGLVRADRADGPDDVAVRLDDATGGPRLEVVLPPAGAAPVPEPGERAGLQVTSPTTLVVAGHDLKFLRPAFDTFERAGVRLLLDEWTSHTGHDEERSERLLSEADAVWCEWGLGNAVWYSRVVGDSRRLTVRVHSQEIFAPYLRTVRHAAVDRYVFVSPVVQEAAVTGHGVPRERCVVVPDMVDVVGLRRPKTPSARKRVALVGAVPRTKRLDLALDVIEAVRREDPEYRLVVKGRHPRHYPWLRDRPGEAAWFDEQLARLARMADEHPGAVELEDHGDDMAEFYRGVDTVLSVSDFESFHLTIADGVASGALPAVLGWPGADLVYPPHWVSADVPELARRILARDPSVTPDDVAHLDVRRVAALLLAEAVGPSGAG